MIYLDTETALIEQGTLAPPLTCLQFALDDGPIVVAVQDVDDVLSLTREILEHHIVGHNIAYDFLVLATEYPDLRSDVLRAYREDRVHDTLIREKLLRISKGTLKGARFSLAHLAAHYGEQKDADDPWRLRYGELRGIPYDQWPSAAREYAVHDVEVTRHVYQCQTDTPDEARQCRAAYLMHCIGAQGVHTDPAAVAAFEQQIEEEYRIDQGVLQAAGLVRADGTKDTKAAKSRMVAICEEPKKTKKGDISLDEESCLLSGDGILQAYQRYGSHRNLRTRLQDLKKGYVKSLNSRFDSLVESGRTSCSKGNHGYQIQNMRRKPGERECFIPRAGNVFLACDFDSFELCALAQAQMWIVGHSALAEAINGGLDPHLAMAASMLGMGYDAAKQAYDGGDERVAETRQGAKIANFGYPGGLGAKGFISYARGFGVDLDLDRALELKEGWLDKWPEMHDYFRWINGHQWQEIHRGGRAQRVTSIKQMRSQRIRGAVSYTQACNSLFQGLAADAAKAAGWALLEWGRWPMWNFVHDEYLLEGPEQEGHDAAMEVQKIMEESAQEWMPDVKISASPTLMYRWSKRAKKVWNNGRLVPWQ
jgi:hypothetical protein